MPKWWKCANVAFTHIPLTPDSCSLSTFYQLKSNIFFFRLGIGMSLKAEPETPPNVGKHSEPLSAKCRKLIWFFLIKKNVQYCLLLVVISKEAFLYFLLYIRFFSFFGLQVHYTYKCMEKCQVVLVDIALRKVPRLFWFQNSCSSYNRWMIKL